MSTPTNDFFGKTSTTSIIAVMMVSGAFFLLGFLAMKFGDDATTRTQIITGLLTSIAAVTGYYFGAAKNRPTDNAAGPVVDNVEKMEVNNNGNKPT
jgi:hypothetical protein